MFIYWGWDTAVTANEETTDPAVNPGRAAVRSTVVLLVTYLLVTVAAQAFAGVGEEGIGLTNPEHSDDVLSSVGEAVLGGWGVKAAPPRRAHLRGRVNPDHDPADRPYDAVDGGGTRRCRSIRHGHPKYQTPTVLHAGPWAWSRSCSTPA